MIIQVSPFATVVLDGSGNGQCAIGPPAGTKWALRLATLAVSTSTNQPQGFLYRGSASGPLELIDSTYTGAQAASAKVGGALYYPGQRLWAVWKGGDPGATATVQVFGQQGARSDPFEDAGLTGEGFANPIVAGTALVIPAINSPGYSPGNGWTINRDGSAAFSSLNIAGLVFNTARAIGFILQAREATDTFDRFELFLDGSMKWGPGGGATDTGLVRVGAGILQLNSTLQLVNSSQFNSVLTSFVSGDANPRFTVRTDGQLFWGPGNAGTDTRLYRSGVAELSADTIKANVSGSAEAWHGMTLLNGFANRGAGFAAASYRLVPSPANTVQLVGQVTAGGASGTVMATLPAGYRPTTEQPFWAYNNTSNVALLGTVGTNGNVTLFGSSLAASNVCQFSGLVSLDL